MGEFEDGKKRNKQTIILFWNLFEELLIFIMVCMAKISARELFVTNQTTPWRWEGLGRHSFLRNEEERIFSRLYQGAFFGVFSF
jgi:hypothetical protein